MLIRLLSLLTVCLTIAGCCPCCKTCNAPTGQNTLTPAEVAEGWLLLFDGETLFGWQPGCKADWKAAEGAISVSEGEQGLLCTTSPFADYVLKVDFQAAKGANSGLFLRTPLRDADVSANAYELNIAPSDNPFPTGGFVKRQKAAAVAESDNWRTFEVTAQGGHFTVKLDGQSVLDYTDPKPVARGLIGLQHNAGKAAFRNIKLKPLGLASIFNGKDLSQWKIFPDMQSKFTVTPEGWINVKDGKGQLESAGQYGDFTLQLEAFVNGKTLNSGVFFRCIPGEQMNGYESQIQNGCKDGDRTQPADCGTGGIFRRVNARRVVADDFQWFSKTIHAVGDHVAIWVNGYQVTDWTDDRKPDPNPRKGLRVEPGTLMLQGHDATTDINFRNFRIAELPK